MLEIGTDENKSIEMWKQYFPKSKIYGIDIESEKKFKRGEIFKVDMICVIPNEN